ARLGLFPRGAAEPIERRAAGAAVLLNEIEPLDRDEQLVLAGVAEFHELLRLETDFDALQSDEQADAVSAVHDEVSGFQVAEVREERSRRRPAPFVDAALFLENVGFGPELQLSVWKPESAAQMADAYEQRGGVRFLAALDRNGKDLVVRQQLDRSLR